MTDARAITLSLRGKWHGFYGTAACPICQPQRRRDQDALTLADGRDGRLLLNCKKLRCSFSDLLAALGLGPGDYRPPTPAELARRAAEQEAEAQRKALLASAIWREALPIGGTAAETYLRGRGITCDLPDTLRFHPALRHPTGATFPAMVATVEGAGRPAIHRTYLRPDGNGKAMVDPAKMMLGACAGGAVRLAEGQGRLVAAEGIETALSLSCGLLRGPATIWAALSTSGLRTLNLPTVPGDIVIAEDSDEAGRAAADALAARAGAAGWRVFRLRPPAGFGDFNDYLRGGVAA